MPSTVNKRCVVYNLAKRVRSQTVSLKFLLILLNKGYNMLYSTENLRWYCNLWSLCMRITKLTICRCRFFGGCNFWKELGPKARYGTLWSFLTYGYHKLQLVEKWKQNCCDTLLQNMKSHIESVYCIESGRRWKMKTPEFYKYLSALPDVY